jgi:Protein of unknown function (DUF3617)
MATRRSTHACRTAATIAALVAWPALAAPDYPKLKPGLWEMTTSSSRKPDAKSKSTLCLDQSLQQDMIRMSSGMMAGMCSKSEFKASGSRFVGEAVCNLGGSTMKSRSVMTMNGDTSYRTEAEATFDPPLGGQSSSKTVIEGRHVGACKPGQQPGDLTTPNGQTINIRNVMSGKK